MNVHTQNRLKAGAHRRDIASSYHTRARLHAAPASGRYCQYHFALAFQIHSVTFNLLFIIRRSEDLNTNK